jgi:hypothetical protein
MSGFRESALPLAAAFAHVERPFKAAMTAFEPAFRQNARKKAVMAGKNPAP